MAYEQGTGMGIWLNPAKVAPASWSTAATTPGAVAPTFKDPLDLMPAVTGIADTMYQMGKNKSIAKPIGIDELTGATIYEPGPNWEIYGRSPLPPNSVYKDELPIHQERFIYNQKKTEAADLQAQITQDEADAAAAAAETEILTKESDDLRYSTLTRADIQNLPFEERVKLSQTMGDQRDYLHMGGRDNQISGINWLFDNIDDWFSVYPGTWLHNWNTRPEWLMSEIDDSIEDVYDAAEVFKISGGFDAYFGDGKHQEEYLSILKRDSSGLPTGNIDNKLYNEWFIANKGKHVLPEAFIKSQKLPHPFKMVWGDWDWSYFHNNGRSSLRMDYSKQ